MMIAMMLMANACEEIREFSGVCCVVNCPFSKYCEMLSAEDITPTEFRVNGKNLLDKLREEFYDDCKEEIKEELIKAMKGCVLDDK